MKIYTEKAERGGGGVVKLTTAARGNPESSVLHFSVAPGWEILYLINSTLSGNVKYTKGFVKKGTVHSAHELVTHDYINFSCSVSCLPALPLNFPELFTYQETVIYTSYFTLPKKDFC